jgi:diacylglycerol kinase family enzyme
MRVLLIVNPSASSTSPRRRVHVEDALGRDHRLEIARLEIAETRHRDHATELARAAAGDGFDVVAVLAGDGTLNEAANGLVGSSTALAPLPGGSTNVFARSIGIANSLEPAVAQIVDALARGSIRRIGLGAANGRRFLFHLGVGFDAAVIARVEAHAARRPWLKRRLAHPTFAVTATTTFLRGYDRRRPTYRVETPGEPDLGPGYYAIVSNATPYAYFGPRPLTVSAHAGLDRALALTMFRRLDLAVLVPAAASAMRTGTRLHRHNDVIQRADLEALTVRDLGRPFPWQVDGDFLGLTERLDVRYEPDALRIVVP